MCFKQSEVKVNILNHGHLTLSSWYYTSLWCDPCCILTTCLGSSLGLPGSGLNTRTGEGEDCEPLCVTILCFSTLHSATKIWKKLIERYVNTYPWKLAALCDSRLDEGETFTLVRHFARAKACCLDEGCGARLQSRLRQWRIAPQPAATPSHCGYLASKGIERRDWEQLCQVPLNSTVCTRSANWSDMVRHPRKQIGWVKACVRVIVYSRVLALLASTCCPFK